MTARRLWPVALAGLLAGLVAAGVLLAAIRVPKPASGQLAGEFFAGQLPPGAAVGQTFVARYGRVIAVDLWLGEAVQPEAGPLRLHVKRSPLDTEDLVSAPLEAVPGGGYYHARFPPTPTGMGEPLYFYVTAPASAEARPLAVWGTAEDGYAEGAAVSEAPLDPRLRDLTFRVYYGPTLRQHLWGLVVQVAAGKPGLAGAPGLYLGLALLYVALLAVLGWLIGSGRWAADDPAAPR